MDNMSSGYFEDAYGEHGRRDALNHQQWFNDSPWDPMQHSFQHPSVSQTSSTSHPIQSPANYGPFQPEWRSVGLPSASDCETVPGGDSGYGSLMPSNIDTNSIQGDERMNASIPDVENELGGFHLSQETQAPRLFSTDPGSGDFNASPSPRPQQMCTECNIPMRTKSEMNKHLQRHKKPHVCPYQDCSRHVNGFASNNDLVRHKRTVHGELNSGRSFVCRHDPCTKKDMKLWPRADNFRSHLFRVHKLKVKAEDDLRDYVHQQQQQTQDLEGIGTNLQDPDSLRDEPTRSEYGPRTDSILEFPEIASPLSVAPQITAAVQSHGSQYLMPPASHHRSRVPISRLYPNPPFHEAEDMKPAPRIHRQQAVTFEKPPREGHGSSQLVSAATVRLGNSVPFASHESSTMALAIESADSDSGDNSDEECKDGVDSTARGTQAFHDKTNPAKSLNIAAQVEYLRSMPKDVLQQILGLVSQSPEDQHDLSHSSVKPNTECNTCAKKFSRPCELRKHNKRHEKPYGCTWYQCNRTFGSKNDWKRHETNQHGQIETWHCRLDCGRVFNSRERFQTHLQKRHEVTDGVLLERTLEESRQGSHCTSSFWCGFCNKLETMTPSEGINVANQRFDHIDDHFMGRNGLKKVRIEEWQYMEEQTDDIDRSTLKKTHPPEADGDGGRKSKRQRAS